MPTYSDHRYAAISARGPYAALAAAECANLTGGTPAPDGFCLCDTIARVSQSAYVRIGLRLVASGTTWRDLLDAVAAADLRADGFRVDCLALSDVARKAPPSRTIALANVIQAAPNLEQPRHRFLLVERDDGLWFGEIVAECSHSYRAHEGKPHRTSTSLPSRLARAMVNLVAPPATSVLDPCCGTGSLLLEAEAMGLRTSGADITPAAVEMARANLSAFQYQAKVELTDIHACTMRADAVVTDLPYGRYMQMSPEAMRRLLLRARTLAPVGVFAAGSDVSESLALAGYRETSVHVLQKHASFARYVHVAR